MARVALGWTLDALAAACGVNRTSILRFEQRQSRPHPKNIVAIRRALEAAGVRFIEGGDFAGGVVPPA